jgi:type IV secretory pathway VirB2 component (pilin)
VVSVDSKGKDVTASYADTEAQIASLKAARNRFLTILSGAQTIGDTLSVQQRVDDVQGQIDRLEGQRRLLADQSSLATLTVTVGVKAPKAAQAKEQGGLSRSWDRAKHGFSSGVEGIVARSGRALLVLIVLGLALLVGRLGWRLARRRLL